MPVNVADWPLPVNLTAGSLGPPEHENAHDDIHDVLNNTANVQAGTAYTLALADFGHIIETTSSSAVTVTVPPNASVAFPAGTVVEVCQLGAGQVTVAQGAGVTIRSPASLVLRAQFSTVSLRKRATDEWVLAGDVV